MIPRRFSSWSFAALRGSKRCSPPPFIGRPNHDPAKVFFVTLRGPSRIKKGVLPYPSWTDQFMIPRRFSSRPFAALRGSKRCSPPPFIGRPNHDPAKVFFVTLRGPSRPFADQKRCSPLPFVDRPIHDPAKVFFVTLRGPSRPFVDQKRCSPLPFVDRPNHDPAKVFSAALRGPSWMKRCSPPPFVGVLPRPSHRKKFCHTVLSSDKRQQALTISNMCLPKNQKLQSKNSQEMARRTWLNSYYNNLHI